MQTDNTDQTMPLSQDVVARLKDYQQYIPADKLNAAPLLYEDFNEDNASRTWTTQIMPGTVRHLLMGADEVSITSPAYLPDGRSVDIGFPKILSYLALYSAIAAEPGEISDAIEIPTIRAVKAMLTDWKATCVLNVFNAHSACESFPVSWVEQSADTLEASESLSVPSEARHFLYPKLITFAETLVELIKNMARTENLQVSKFKWSVCNGVEEDAKELVLNVVIRAEADAALNFWDKIGDAITERSNSLPTKIRDQSLRRLSIDVSWE